MGFFTGGFDAMFGIVFVIVIIGFIFVFGTMIAKAVAGAKEYRSNNASPVLTVPAKVVAKRADVSHYRHSHGTHHASHTTSTTTYYVTFQFESGDRAEFRIADKEYGLIAEYDEGKLTFQGTRYLGFQR